MVLLVGFVVWELRTATPLVDVRLFARPAFIAANVAGLVVFFSFVGAVVYFSAYFQQIQGRSPIQAGLDVSAIGVAFTVAAPVSGGWSGASAPWRHAGWSDHRRGGGARPAAAGTGHRDRGDLVGLRRRRAGYRPVPDPDDRHCGGVRRTGPDRRAGMASAVHNALRQIGQVLGVAVLGALVYGQLTRDGPADGRLNPAQAALFVTGLHHALWVSGLALLAAAALVALTPSQGGE